MISMLRLLQRYFVWAVILSAMAVAANWPRSAGTLKPHIYNAGFPLSYAFWNGEELTDFHVGSLVINLLVWLIAFGLVVTGTSLQHRRNASLAHPSQGTDRSTAL